MNQKQDLGKVCPTLPSNHSHFGRFAVKREKESQPKAITFLVNPIVWIRYFYDKVVAFWVSKNGVNYWRWKYQTDKVI